MARIRTIKPDFFTSEDIVSLSPLARLLFIAIWCEADKEGRLGWKPKTLKMRYLPGDSADIDSLCAELTASGLVRLYGDGLAYVPGFAKHQHVNPRESASDLPEPPNWVDPGAKKIGKLLREFVLERDGHCCVRCESTDKLQLDHILPQSSGGPHVAENLRVLCRSCNAARPVQGEALIADLAQDGLTIESLRARFGIDASIPDKHAQGGREGKGREGKIAKSHASKTPMPDGFEISERVRAWATEKGHTQLEARLESFKGQCAAKGYVYADWDAAFMNAIRDNWAKLGPSPTNTLPAGGRRRLG